MRPEDFYTRTRASQGVRVDLQDPAGNKEWIKVRSTLSVEFASAVNRSWEQISASHDVGPEVKQRRRVRHAEQAASLIADWSLPPGIDPIDLLVKNPRLRRQIERIAENHKLHFGADHD